MSELGKMIGKPKEVKRFAPDNRFVMPRSLIGVEYEFEGVKTLDHINLDFSIFWQTHRDDSLKDHGMEFSFRSPLFGEDLYQALKFMHTVAEQGKFKASTRCGIHIHSDARDMDGQQLIGQTILYAIFEPLLFRWIGDNRENSIFCVPFYKADESLLESGQVIRSIVLDEKGSQGNTLNSAEKVARYAAYNLNALHKFGSVEYRHMRTTHDINRVIDWINIVLALKQATERFPTSDGAIIQMARNTAPNVFLTMVFGEDLARKLWCADAADLIRKVGLPVARDLVQYGLTLTDFDEVEIPKGTHKGFATYMATPNKRTPSSEMPQPRIDLNRYVGGAPRPAGQRPLIQAPDPWGGGVMLWWRWNDRRGRYFIDHRQHPNEYDRQQRDEILGAPPHLPNAEGQVGNWEFNPPVQQAQQAQAAPQAEPFRYVNIFEPRNFDEPRDEEGLV